MDDLAQRRDAFLERLLQSTRGTFELFSIYIGVRLGLYEALARGGPQTSTELASRTATVERYVREWLEQQTVAGILEVDDERAEARKRRFTLPAAYVEVLVDQDSLNYLAPLTRLVAGAVHPLDAVLEAYRSGGGVAYADYGVDVREGQAGVNRAMFLKQLGREWLPAIPDVHARLGADPPARIADVGCGAGWSSIGMAQSYPKVLVDGFDLDVASLDLARANAAAAGLADRIKFHTRDAGDPEQLAGRYDLVTAFECIHDMAQPVSALKAMRRLAGARGGRPRGGRAGRRHVHRRRNRCRMDDVRVEHPSLSARRNGRHAVDGDRHRPARAHAAALRGRSGLSPDGDPGNRQSLLSVLSAPRVRTRLPRLSPGRPWEDRTEARGPARRCSMRFAVIGGTGVAGHHVVEALRRGGHAHYAGKRVQEALLSPGRPDDDA